MSTRLPARLPSPLVVAAGAYAAGGLGNVAFVAHSGSPAGFLLLRFALGALIALVLVRVRFAQTRPRGVKAKRRSLLLTGALDATSVALLVFAAANTSVMVVTIISALTPALAALGARWLGLALVPKGAARWAIAAVFAGSAAVVAGSRGDAQEVTLFGVALAVGSALCAVGSLLAGARASHGASPPELIASVCGFGVVAAGVVVAAGSPVVITTTTVIAAIFVAVITGGIAKAALFWSAGRESPALVSSCQAAATLTAAVGAWLLLAQRPTALQMVFAAIAAGLVAKVAFTRQGVAVVAVDD